MSVKLFNGRLVNGSMGEFTPKSIAGCVLWLDAADASTISLNGSKVSQWDDKSDSGFDAVQATEADQPDYNATGMNGKGTIDFVAADTEFLSCGDNVVYSNTNGMSVFVVVDHTDDGANQMIVTKYDAANNKREWYLATTFADTKSNFSTQLANGTFDPDEVATIAAYAPTVPTIFSSIWVPDVSTDIYANGGSKSSAVDAAPTMTDTDEPIYVGKQGPANNYMNGKIAEIIIYNTALSDAARQAVETYLSNKWGITI